MPDPNEPFIPQFVDEQIEQLTHALEKDRQIATTEEEMLQDIQDLYREYAGTRDRVRQRLQEQMARGSRAEQAEVGTLQSLSSVRQRRRRNNSMQYIQKKYSESHSMKPRLTLLAATLFAALLVVALTVVVPFVRSISTQPGTTGSPVASTGNQAPESVYIGNSNGILKLDSRTGATLKSYPWDHQLTLPIGTIEPYALQMDGKLLYVGVNIKNPAGNLFYTGVEGLDPNTGKTWSYLAPTNDAGTMAIANGRVYMSVDNPDTSTPASLVFALRATDGAQLATYNVPTLVSQLTVANGFLYAKDYGNLYGVNLATKATWSRLGSVGADQGFSAFQVVNGVIYASLYQGTGSYIMALRPETGALIWQSQEIPGKIFNFTIAHNVVYFGTDAPLSGITVHPGCYCDGRFDAYDIQQQKILWEQSAGRVAQTYAVSNGVVYAVIQFPYAGGPVDPELIALSADHGKLLWHANAGAQDYRFEPVVTNGHVYIAAGTAPQFPGTQLDMFAQTSGQLIWKKHFSARIWVYTVIVG